MAGQVNAVVIGGANMDIAGSSLGPLVPGDSNPGTVSLRHGGVGRNIAHDLRLMGAEVSLLTAVGDDAYGRELLCGLRQLGVDTGMSLCLPGCRSSSYLYIADETGEMRLAINDMEIVRRLSPEAVAPHLEQINRADAVLVEANLPKETLRFLAEEVTAPLYADPVSAAKAPRLRGILGRLRAIKPNRFEAAALTGETEPERAALSMLDAGVARVYLSLGAEGLLAAEKGRMLRVPCEPGPVLNVTGAGDAATAALLWAELRGFGLEEAARLAQKAAALACASHDATPPSLSGLL